MKKNIFRTFIFMFSTIFLAKILGLIRKAVFGYYYGTGMEATAFLTAARIPLQLLDMTLGAAISSSFIPVYNELLQKKGKEKAIEFANNFLNIIIVISVLLSTIGIIYAPQIIKIIAPNLESSTFFLTINLIRILFPMMIFTAVAFVLVGFLQSMDEFKIPSMISAVANGVLILYLLLFNEKFGIYGVAVAMLIGWSTQVLVQLPATSKKGFHYHLRIDFNDSSIKKVGKLALPILISTWVQPINNLINLRLASGLENGEAIPAIEYAYELYLVIVGVFSYTLSNIIFPELSKLTADQNKEKQKQILNHSIKLSFFIIIPISVGIVILGNDIVKMIYERGVFNTHSTLLTGNALSFYAIGMIGYGVMEVLNKAFYAMQDSKTPLLVSIFSISINIVLSIIFVRKIGYVGLPLAASITSIITACIMLKIVSNKIEGILEMNSYFEFCKILICSIIMGIIVLLIHGISFSSTILLTVISAFTGGIVYFGVMYILKSEIMLLGIKMIEKEKKPMK